MKLRSKRIPAVTVAGAAVLCAALAVLAAGAGGSVDGSCTVNEPGAASQGGYAGYAEHVTPTVRGFDTGSLAITIVCETPGTEGDIVTLILPNLVRGATPAPGEYRVRSPTDSLSQEQMLDRRLAWARVARGGGSLLFTARGGSIRIVAVRDGVLEGAYHVAIAAADSSLSLPGARPEAGGTFRTDSAGRPILAPTVLGGAFVAVRTEADWRGR
jgi:hypothetical protein